MGRMGICLEKSWNVCKFCFWFQVRISPDCRRIDVRPACKQHDSNTQWYSWPSEVLNLIKKCRAFWDVVYFTYVHRPLIPPLSGNGANIIGNSVLASTTLVTVENCSNGDSGRAKQIANSLKMQPTAGSAETPVIDRANSVKSCSAAANSTSFQPTANAIRKNSAQ